MRPLLTNTEAMQAMMQIQQGMQRLQQAAPGGVLSGLGLGGLPAAAAAAPATTPNPINPLLNQQSSQYFSQMLNMMGNQTIVIDFQLIYSKCLLAWNEFYKSWKKLDILFDIFNTFFHLVIIIITL